MATVAWVTTLRDLGIPTIVGAVLGAAIGAWAQKRGRDLEHERSLDMLVLQWQRSAAEAADVGLRQLARRLKEGEAPGLLYNDWQDSTLGPAIRVGDPEITRRASVIGWMLLHASFAKQGIWQFAVLSAIEDGEAAIAAFLRRQEIPSAHCPPMEELQRLIAGSEPDRFPAFVELNLAIAERSGEVT